MPSELESFRDHCKAMATWEPPKPKERLLLGQWCRDMRAAVDASDEWAPNHERCTWDRCACDCHPKPEPPAGPSDADRALFARLAAEVDAYLSTDEDEGLFA